MIVNEERKTTGKQRLIILAIAAFMLFSIDKIGTLDTSVATTKKPHSTKYP